MDNGVGFKCKKCGERIFAAARHIKRVAKCPNCQEHVVVDPIRDNPHNAMEYTEIKFDCPECGKSVIAHPDDVGTEIKHTLCNKSIKINSPESGGSVKESRPDYSQWIALYFGFITAFCLIGIFSNIIGPSIIGIVVFGLTHSFKKIIRIRLLKLTGRDFF